MPGRAPRLAVCSLLAASIFAFPSLAAPDPLDPPPLAIAGTDTDPCGAEIHLEASLKRDPEMAARRAAIEALVREAQQRGLVPPARGGPSTSAAPIYTIPTVVHVIYTAPNAPENISDAQVFSQIEAVNRDLQNTLNYGSPATDCQIRLCLATRDPSGNPINGITRHPHGTATIPMDQPVAEAAFKTQGYYPSNRYLNVWVVKRITVGGGGNVVGYATFPGSVPAAVDGIVMDYRFMGANNTSYGNIFSLPSTYEEGKVFPHEVGHYLDLYHTFHGGCQIGDLCNDTPWEAVNFTGCPSGTQTTICNSITYPAPFHNFMDYTNDPCRWEFTPDQKTRMFAALTGPRSQLVSASNIAATLVGACQPNVIASFTASTKLQCTGPAINFSAANCGGTCTYSWTFQGGVGNTTAQNTSATFSQPGAHAVTLTVTGTSSSATVTDTVYITACTPITGPCTNWVFGNKARLDFSSGVPVAVAGNYRNVGHESAAQISSSAGSLLFYTNNDTIWNVNHLPMAGAGQPARGRSSHTGALVIPRPGAASDYFVLSILEAEQWGGSKPIYAMSTVNMTGLGSVTALNTAINLPIAPPLAPSRVIEGVTAIPHCNGNDWWAITCGADSINLNSDWQRFLYVTPITNSGAGTSLQYPIGFFGGTGNPGLGGWGSLTASRDGNQIAICQAHARAVHVYRFDRATGTPVLALDTGDISVNQDVEFSPDGKLIYYCYIVGKIADISGNGSYGIRQMDLATQQVRTLRAPTGISLPFDLQLGPDDKIYVARPGEPSLDVVVLPNNFNNTGNECGYIPNAIGLGAGVMVNTTGTLPNTVSMCATTVPPASFTVTRTGCKSFTFTSPNCGPWDWYFGDTQQMLNAPSTVTHTYTGNGPYTVQLVAISANPTTATQQVITQAQPITIAGPGSACGGPLNYTAVGPAGYTYQWTITGGSPPSATGNNVFVSWGLGSVATVQVVGTDPVTGCTSTATKSVDPCANCTPPPANMIAWWPLDETSGSIAHEIVGARDGADINTTKLACAVKNGRQFNAINSYVHVNHHNKLNLGTGNLTIDAWIRTTSNPTTQGIIEKRSLSPDLGYALYLKNGDLAMSLGDGTTSTEYVATSNINLIDGLWHHVAVTEDRGNGATGTTLYIDAVPVTVLPGFAGSFSLDNTENLLIGAQEPSSSPTGNWSGEIDEVEIFNRCLTGEEVAKIYGAGAGGKCKEFVYSPTATTLCSLAPFVDVPFDICNYSGSQQSYALSFAGTTGAGCTFAGPSTFTILSTNTNGVVSAGTGCTQFVVRVFKPNGMMNGDVSCFQITATNTSNNVSRASNASFWASESVCPLLTSKLLTSVGVGVSVPHTFQIQNTSLVPQVVNVQVDARGVDQPILVGGGAVSLNGQPPGFPWYTSYALAPGETTPVNVSAEFVEPAPFIPYDIILAADIDGNSLPDAAAAAGMIYGEPPLDVVAVAPPAPVLPTRFELVNATPNPFHRALAVEFDLPRASAVKLELFDMSGRRVRSAAESSVPAGRARRVVDGGGLPSGVYVVRLDAGGEVRMRRVVLLRK